MPTGVFRLVIAALLAGSVTLSWSADLPAATSVQQMNQVTVISAQPSAIELRIHSKYLLQDIHRNSATIQVVSRNSKTGEKATLATLVDNGTGGADFTIGHEPGTPRPAHDEILLLRIVSHDGKILTEKRIPIAASSSQGKRVTETLPDHPEMFQVVNRINKLFKRGDFATLDELCEKWKDGRQQTSDGRWMLEGFQPMLGYGLEEGWWERNTQIIGNWRRDNSESECAPIMEAEAWIGHALQWKKNGNHNTGYPPARSQFRDRLETAERILLTARPYADDNPLWHERYLYVLNQLGRSKETIFSAFLEAIGKANNYYPVYQTTAVAMTPRWGGDYDIVGKIADAALDLAPGTEGQMIYTRIYWAVDDSMPEEGQLFRKTRASWPVMKAGFQALMQQHPGNTYNLNHFASFACVAGDGETFLELRYQLAGSVIDRSAWNSNYSLDVCDHTFMMRL